MNPGDRILYVLDADDAARVNQRRDDFTMFQATRDNHKHPHAPIQGGSGASGHQAHIGLPVHAGQALPADVVIAADSGNLCLRVLLPGSDVLWVTNVAEGNEPGQWRSNDT